MGRLKLFFSKNNATRAKHHLKNHRGDENVTKMLWVVTVFVVGTLVLSLIMGAFRNNQFETVKYLSKPSW